jgi:DNA polymerase III alpha subunit (gram-positive type)
MPLALIFDVETTGLIPKFVSEKFPYPYIIQLSFALYDTDSNKLVETYNNYIKIQKTVVLTEVITNLTGITREMIDSLGIPCGDALNAFYAAYMKADILVAHNLKFDKQMIHIEICANLPHLHAIFDQRTLASLGKKEYCTMMEGIPICAIECVNSRGPYLKQPKLSELFEKLFDEPAPENLHNSMVDVLACLRCFVKMYSGASITGCEFAEWVEYATA